MSTFFVSSQSSVIFASFRN